MTSWIRDSAITINSLDEDADFDDLEPLINKLRAIQVLGIGEATHGTSEFFRLKSLLFEFAVLKLGFRVLGIEADWSECLPINDYVLDGKGDPEKALCRIGTPHWKCREVLSLIQWIRQYNSGLPRHDFDTKCVYFVGLEQSQSYWPAKWLEKYFQDLGSPAASKMATVLEKIADYDTNMRKNPMYLGHVADSHSAANKELLKLKTLQAEAMHYVTRQVAVLKTRIVSSKPADPKLRRDALHRLEVFKWGAMQQMSGMTKGSNIRDQAIALSVQQSIKQYGKDTKVFVWAHNGHVSTRAGRSWIPAGVHLRRRFGNKYYCIGQSFLKGTFLANDDDGDFSADLAKWKTFSVDPPNFDCIENTLADANMDIFVVDFRSAPPTPAIQTWLHTKQGVRNCASGFSDRRKTNWHNVTVPAVFDGMTFVKSTTASQAFPCSKPSQ